MKAVSIDDEEINLLIIEGMSKELNLDIISFQNPIKAFDFIKKNDIDFIFVDYVMPELNGIELIKKIRTCCEDIPIIMITSISDNEDLKLNAIKSGATEFLHKPLNAPEFTARVTNLIQLRKIQLLLKDRALLLEEEIKKATEKVVKREFETLNVLGNAAEFKDPETGHHIKRVALYSKLIAEKMNLNATDQDLIFLASPLHDVGKIGIPDLILLKAGKLTKNEFNIMKTHTTKGYDILLNTESEYMKAGAIISLTHHEKFDGTGYPYGLRGENIHLFGRITAVADVFDALTSTRPYKEAWTLDKAFNLILSEKSKHFDPKIVDIFLENKNNIKKIYKEISMR